MAKEILPSGLWERIEPALAEMDPRHGMGRPRIPNRAVLTGILFVLKTGVPWEHLPGEMGCGSGMTCWRRLQRWIELGVWDRVHQALLDELQESGKLDWSRASLDASSIPAKKGGSETGPNPTDRGRAGSKHHLIVDRRGIPLVGRMGPANRHDSTVFESLVDAVPAVRTGRRGRPRQRPEKLHADKGYDFRRCRKACRARGITPRIARRGIES